MNRATQRHPLPTLRRAIPLMLAALLAACAQAPRQPVTEPAPTPTPTPAPLPGEGLRPEVRAFIADVAARHSLDADELVGWLREARTRTDIIEAISRPAEAKPWHKYRPIFLTELRIRGGVDFWAQHADILAQASAQYQVPPEIIVAILGVETLYGKNSGNYRVLDALTTLAFDYPPRADFFRSELEHYFLLTREEGLDPLTMKGSYAGAMGQGQFIPSSYRNYAVDFDGDGRRDLLGNARDIIGSVANYFHQFGWEYGTVPAVRAQVEGEGYTKLLEQGVKPSVGAAQLVDYGVTPEQALPPDLPVALIRLDGDSGPEYWLGSQNFYVITRYNRSPLYAMAVYQLSQEIAARHAAQSAQASVQSNGKSAAVKPDR